MKRYILGGLVVAQLWIMHEWFKNPKGHRGGSRLGQEPDDEILEDPEPEISGYVGGSLPVRYHRN